MSDPKALRRGDKAITEVAELHRILDEAPVLRLAMIDEGHPYVASLSEGVRPPSCVTPRPP